MPFFLPLPFSAWKTLCRAAQGRRPSHKCLATPEPLEADLHNWFKGSMQEPGTFGKPRVNLALFAAGAKPRQIALLEQAITQGFWNVSMVNTEPLHLAAGVKPPHAM